MCKNYFRMGEMKMYECQEHIKNYCTRLSTVSPKARIPCG